MNWTARNTSDPSRVRSLIHKFETEIYEDRVCFVSKSWSNRSNRFDLSEDTILRTPFSSFRFCTIDPSQVVSLVQTDNCDPSRLGSVVNKYSSLYRCAQQIQVDMDHNCLCAKVIQLDMDQLCTSKTLLFEVSFSKSGGKWTLGGLFFVSISTQQCQVQPYTNQARNQHNHYQIQLKTMSCESEYKQSTDDEFG